jgi:Holliday junction resolvase-like predicted endonuclease
VPWRGLVAVNDALKLLGARILHQRFTPERILDAVALVRASAASNNVQARGGEELTSCQDQIGHRRAAKISQTLKLFFSAQNALSNFLRWLTLQSAV